MTDWVATVVAAFMATTVIRKLPGIRTLVTDGVKPFACDVCMASWTALGWRLAMLDGCTGFTVALWWLWLRDTAAMAGLAYVALWGLRCAQARLGMMDGAADQHYLPPKEI